MPYSDPFPSVLGSIVAYRTYLQRLQNDDGTVRMQTWEENADRNSRFLSKLGGLSLQQQDDIRRLQCELVVTPPGRVLWAARDEWVDKVGYANYLGLFNCVGVRPTSWRWLGLEFLLLMMGCGVGSIVEEDNVALFPAINERVPKLLIANQPGTYAVRPEATTYTETKGYLIDTLTIHVGDSKEGWVDAYVKVLEVCSDPTYTNLLYIDVDLGGVRPNGASIKGFGGTANPVGLPPLFEAVITILQGASGRQLTAAEVCLLENEAAKATVAGNIRRSARWGGYSYLSPSMTGIKDNLWYENPVTGKWEVDEARDALRMTNLSAIFHRKPTLEECRESVRKQYDTGEGALWYAPAALVRTNIDLLPTKQEQQTFEHAYTVHGRETGRAYLRAKLYERYQPYADNVDGWVVSHPSHGLEEAIERELDHCMQRYGANPCCLVAGTMVLTKGGHYPIESLVSKDEVEVWKPEVEVWDGKQWIGTCFYITNVNQDVYEVVLADGTSITATGYHRFILANGTEKTLLELEHGDVLMDSAAPLVETLDPPGSPYRGTAYLRGFLLADGTHKDGAIKLKLHTSKKDCMARLVSSAQHDVLDPVQGLASIEGTFKDTSQGWWMQGLGKHSSTLMPWVTTYRDGLPPEVYNYTLGEKCHLIAGYFDANGEAVELGKAFGYKVAFTSLQLLQDMQLLLWTMGISSHHDRSIYEGCDDIDDPCYLYLPRSSSTQLSKLVTFTTLKSYSGKVIPDDSVTNRSVLAVVLKGRAPEVYCCNVPTNHRFALSNGILTGNCTTIDVEAIERELDHRMQRYGANPCCEILGHNFVCSLSQVDLSRFDTTSPTLREDIDAALDTAALIVCSLLKRGFDIPELQESREVDPIVAVTLNGVFDFLVQLWGEPWLRWWMAGSPEYWHDPVEEDAYINTSYGGWQSQMYIENTEYMFREFRDRVRDTVTAYCTEHGLRIPNRYTAIQPSGSKSCLTGGTPACYTPKGQYWIRRVTVARNHPVALAAIDYGYNVVPSSSCRDEHGALLDDPYDERATEWLIEVPQECVWSSDMVAEYDVANAPIESQWRLTMQVQKHYVTHNTSVTLEINEGEVDTLAELMHAEIHGGGDYVSSAIYARDKGTMPRMPYEPISRQQYEQMVKDAESRKARMREYDQLLEGVVASRGGGIQSCTTFKSLVEYYYNLDAGAEMGPTAGCDGDSCTVPTLGG